MTKLIYYIIVRNEKCDNVHHIAWSKSKFLFKEYINHVFDRYAGFNNFSITYSSAQTMKDIKWVYKAINLPENKITRDEIILVHDKDKELYGITTKKKLSNMNYSSIRISLEDKLISQFYNNLFYLTSSLRRFSELPSSTIDEVRDILSMRFLAQSNIDVIKYELLTDCDRFIYRCQ